MKRLTPLEVEEKWRPLRIWRDGLMEMASVFLEACDDRDTRIICNEYVLDDISELPEVSADRIVRLDIQSKDQRLRLFVGKHGGFVKAVEPNIAERGMIHEVARLGRQAALPRWPVVLAGAVTSIALGLPSVLILGSVNSVSAAMVALGTAMIVGYYAAKIPILTQSRMYNLTRKEAPPFFVRMRDDIIIAGCSLLVGGAIGYVTALLTAAD